MKKLLKNGWRFGAQYPKLATLIKFSLIFALFWLIGWYRLDPDFGWHLRSGQYIWAHGIPAHDVFSYPAAAFKWINHEWGNDVLLASLYSLGGYALATTFFAALWTLAFFVAGRALSFVVLLTGAIAVLPYAGIRPQVWTLLGFVLLLKLVQQQRRRTLILIPLLFIVWANLHGGFVIGLAYLAYLAVKKRSKFWLLVLALSLLATFINPYGPALYVEISRTLFDRSLHSQVTEWLPFYILPPSWPYIVLWGAGFWLYARRKLKNWLNFEVLLLAAAMSSSRNIPLFVIASLKATDDYWRRVVKSVPKKLDMPRQMVLFILTALAVWSLFYGLKISYWPFRARENSYPRSSVEYLAKNGCPGHLFNDYNYGGYLIWKLPNVPVFIDGRMPSWRNEHSQKYMDNYYKMLKDKDLRNAQFSQYNVRCVLLSRSSRNNQLLDDLEKAGWRQTVKTGRTELLVK